MGRKYLSFEEKGMDNNLTCAALSGTHNELGKERVEMKTKICFW